MKPRIYALCEKSATILLPWAMFGGFQCECIDFLNDNRKSEFPNDGSITYTHDNVMSWSNIKQPAIVFSFPPCTHLACSGARHFKNKGLKKLIEGLSLVERCRELSEGSIMWMLENPVGTLSTYWREPNYKIQPFEYGGYLEDEKESVIARDGYSKNTCLWTSDTFVLPDKKPVANVKGSIVHTDLRDAQERSAFPMSFSYAVYLFNKKLADA